MEPPVADARQEVFILEKFLMLPKSIFEAVNKAKLSMSERWILLVLMQFADNERGFCFASNETIAKTAGVSVKTVKRSLQILSKKGFISIQPFLEDYSHYGEVTVNGVTYPKVYRKIEVPHLEPTLVGGKNTQGQIDTQGQNVPGGQGQNVPGGQGQNVPTIETKKKNTKNNYTKNKVSKGSKSDKPTSEPLDDRLEKTAMKIAQEKGVDDPVAYHYGILKNWRKKGIKTWKDYQKAEEANANSTRSNSRGRSHYEEKLPEWAQEKTEEKSKKKAENVDRTATVNRDISRLMNRIESKKKGEEQHDRTN